MHIATMIEKAPHGGYVLKQIVFSEDGPPTIEVLAYRTTLPEISMHELAMKQQAFREAAWFSAPAQQVEPPRPPTPAPQHEEPFEMPKVYGGNGHDHEVERLTAGLAERTGRVSAIVAFAFCTAVAMSFSLRGLVA